MDTTSSKPKLESSTNLYFVDRATRNDGETVGRLRLGLSLLAAPTCLPRRRLVVSVYLGPIMVPNPTKYIHGSWKGFERSRAGEEQAKGAAHTETLAKDNNEDKDKNQDRDKKLTYCWCSTVFGTRKRHLRRQTPGAPRPQASDK